MDPIRVIVYGVGAMGSLMTRLLDRKPNAHVVGAVDRDPAKVGRDAGLVAGLDRALGFAVTDRPSELLDRVACDVVMLATTAFAAEALPQILAAVERRCAVVSIVQELFSPLGANEAIASEIDRAAKGAGVAVTAVGINPGFAMDLIPIVCSVACWELHSVTVRRRVDFSPYGPDEMVHIGAGLTAEEFRAGAASGTIGHIGLLETAAMVSRCLGLGVDELRQTKEPLITDRTRTTSFVTVPAGRVYGFRQNVLGVRASRPVLDLGMVGVLDPQPDDDLELGDYTRITGVPDVELRIAREISQKGGLGTAAVAVNTVPAILAAAPGFRTMDELVVPRIWSATPPPQLAPRVVAG